MNNFKKSLERLKLIVLIAPVLSFSCTNKGQILIKVSETANIKRSLEYIEISWETKSPPLLTEKFSLKEPDGSLIEGQIINIKETPPGLFWVSAVFPVAIDANESKEYIVIRQESRLEPFLKVKGKSIGVTVENDHFIADLSTNTETYTPSYPGQIRSVTLKNFNNKILKSKI